jgi:hypothetical protein
MAKILKASLIAVAASMQFRNAEVGESGSNPATASAEKPAEKQPEIRQQPMEDGRVLVTFPFKFRKKKEKQTGPDGKEVEVATQRAGFEVSLAKHTQETLLEIFVGENNAVKDYIVSLVNDELYAALKAQTEDKPDAKSFGDLDSSLLTIEQLAKDAAAGGGGKPEKEDFEKFCAHYIKVMPAVAGVSTDAAKNAASEFMNGRFTKTAYHENILKNFQLRLATYVEKAPDAGDFEDTVQWLQKKIERLLAAISGSTEY